MSGGSGCQQIKLFVFRPGFGTLSLRSASVSPPVTLRLSLYLSLPPLPVPFSSFFSPCLFSSFAAFQPPAPPLLNCYSLLSCTFSPSLPLLLFSLCTCLRCNTMRLCWWSLSVCVQYVFMYVYLTAGWRWSLLMKPVSVHVCVYISVCLLCMAQHDGNGLCWWSFSLTVSADISSLPEKRQMHCSGGRETRRREGDLNRIKRLKHAQGCID